MILDQAHTVLDVLKVVRTIVSQTYLEGDAMVSHAEIEIRDVAPLDARKRRKRRIGARQAQTAPLARPGRQECLPS